jgi:DNA-binding PadR family transcriptional regulator
MSNTDFESCPCSGKSMSTLVGPWILLTLHYHPGTHGYEIQRIILNRLQEMDLGLNMAGMYRHLNQLEKRGMLTSTWDTGEPGPAKRQYHLTDAGKECLWRWISTLGNQLTLIGKFLDEAQLVFPQAVLPKVMISKGPKKAVKGGTHGKSDPKNSG